ncbi:hypothetical protein PMI28_05148 [Pseudomonas sp. GM48]|nr:hypothetical protein PMI28_05148 [Pseudomonas sp. GM48]
MPARWPGIRVPPSVSPGCYLYKVELRDPQGIDWDAELDAVSGQFLKDHQDW